MAREVTFGMVTNCHEILHVQCNGVHCKWCACGWFTWSLDLSCCASSELDWTAGASAECSFLVQMRMIVATAWFSAFANARLATFVHFYHTDLPWYSLRPKSAIRGNFGFSTSYRKSIWACGRSTLSDFSFIWFFATTMCFSRPI